VPVFGGSHQTLVRSLAISAPSAGFDLDFDGEPDNLLGALGSIANGYIEDSMQKAEIIIPLEFFGLDSATDDDCVNFTLYVGVFPPDQDGDGERTGGAAGSAEHDCNDWDPAITPANATDIPGDGVDNDCNGLADETFDGTDHHPSTDTADYDGDGYSLADGDCDDRVPSDWPDAPAHWDPTLINPGQIEICGDGFDNNCNGVADEDCDPLSNDDGADETIPIDTLSLVGDESEAIIVFRSGRVESGVLYAGPSRFSVSVDLEGRPLELNLTSAMLQADVTIDQYGLHLENGMLGGVLSGQSLDRVPNIAVDFLGGDENSTMLDIIVGSIGAVLSLPTLRICVPREDGVEMLLPVVYCEANADCGDVAQYRCKSDVRAPDIDVDDDGVEIFLDLNLDGDPSIEAVTAPWSRTRWTPAAWSSSTAPRRWTTRATRASWMASPSPWICPPRPRTSAAPSAASSHPPPRGRAAAQGSAGWPWTDVFLGRVMLRQICWRMTLPEALKSSQSSRSRRKAPTVPRPVSTKRWMTLSHCSICLKRRAMRSARCRMVFTAGGTRSFITAARVSTSVASCAASWTRGLPPRRARSVSCVHWRSRRVKARKLSVAACSVR
jgi:hypothetical protein